ncbi:MAG TPA: hypothetical protein VIN09_02135, partial [Chloroflexota bacterium]
MLLAGLVELVRQLDSVKKMATAAAAGPSAQMVVGADGSQKSVLVAGLFSELRSQSGAPATVLVLTPTRQAAERWYEDLQQLLGEEAVGYFPALETLPHEEVTPSVEFLGRRIDALMRLAGAGRTASVVVAEISAAAERLVPPDVLRQFVLHLRVGQQVDMQETVRLLAGAGYERQAKVQAPRQMSVRGDILDVFPPDQTRGIRIEWFGDEIESIRYFDVESQRSLGHLQEVVIAPARELLLTEEALSRGLEGIEQSGRRQVERLKAAGRRQEAKRLEERIEAHLERLASTGYVEGADQYRPLFYPELPLLPEYMTHGLVVFDEPARLKERLQTAATEWTELFDGLLERGRVLPEEMR